jgi:dynein heavy chain
MEFSNNNKDSINDETIELLQPYLTLRTPNDREVFVGPVAKMASAALQGLCVWAAAMSEYQKESKIQ